MKVLHINASYKPAWIYGGPTLSVSALCEALVAADIKTTVYTTTANGSTELDIDANKTINVEGVEVTYFKRITKDHTHFSPGLLVTLWKTARLYDVIHIHAWWNTVSILSCLIGLKKRVPVVISPRGMLSDYSFAKQNTGKKAVIHRLLGKGLLNKVFIHVTAESEKLEIEKIVQPKGFSVIPNIIQVPAGVAVSHIDDSPFKIIFLSRIDPKKGLDILFEALAQVSTPWQLTVAGAGDQAYIDSLKTMAERLKISQNIKWVGFVGDEKLQLLSQHHLFVLPSHNENFGNAVIESLSAGTAVLVSDHVGLADYINDKKLGWACPALPSALSENIDDIATNRRGELKEIRIKAPQITRRDFDKSVLVHRYIDLYQQIISNGRI